MKNTFWDISSQGLDLTEFLGKTPTSPFVLVRGSPEERFNLGDTGYMDRSREFRTLYIRSNLSLALEQGSKNGVLFATSYDGKDIPNNLTFEQFQSVGSPMKITWNAAKKIYTTEGIAPEFLIARNDTYFGIITRSIDETSNYDHGVVGGVESQDTNFIYLSTDRPIYRTGDDIQFKGILRNFSPKGYILSSAKKVKVRVIAESGEALSELVLTPDGNSTINGKFTLPKEMKTGRYSFEILTYAQVDMKDGGSYAINDANFFVEQYVKPTFKVSVTSGDRMAYLGDTRVAKATAEYYFGGRVSNAPVRWTLRSQDYYFDPKEYSGYQFTTDSGFFECRYWGICTSRDQFLGEKVSRLDGNGEATFETSVDSSVPSGESPKERLVTFEAEVTDPNTGRTVRNTSTNIVHVTDGYIGVRTPYYVAKKDPIRIE